MGDGAPTSDDALDTDATWHLLSNPYEKSFDLSDLNLGKDADGDTNPDFQGTVQVWDPSNGSYTSITQAGGDSDVIAPWQGLFVERSDNSSGAAKELTFSESGRTTGGSLIGSKARGTLNYRAMGLRLVAEDAEGTELARDEAARLYFRKRADAGWDFYDATKLTPFVQSYVTVAPLGAANDSTKKLKAQESRTFSPDSLLEIPLNLQIANLDPSQLTLSVPEWKNVPTDWTVNLIDTKGTTDLADDDTVAFGPEASYTFTASGAKTKGKSATARSAQSKTAQRGPPSVTPLRRKQSGASRLGKKTEANTDTTRFVLRVDPDPEPLPVEMAKFDARVQDRSVFLQWATASEMNNVGFYVEHQRLPARDTAASVQPDDWTRQGFVKGTGTTDSNQKYTHRVSDLDYGRHAFRLQQVDTDGDETYSRVVKTLLRLDGGYAVGAPYPNPVRQRATLPVTVRNKQRVTVRVYDLLGRRVRTAFDRAVPAQQTTHISIPARQLSSGTYFVRVRGKKFSQTKRMTVVK